jgi:hypothetical protein
MQRRQALLRLWTEMWSACRLAAHFAYETYGGVLTSVQRALSWLPPLEFTLPRVGDPT